ncbi:uncharacterized protein LOC144144575 [Haemaphysalis longicornis]
MKPFFVQWILLCLVASTHASEADPFEWCGGRLNVLENAKTAAVASRIFWSCRNETMRLNIRPAFIQEVNRICATWRLCYSLLEDSSQNSTSVNQKVMKCISKIGEATQFLFPEWKKLYNFDVNSFHDAMQRCAYPLLPKGVMYGLKSMDYFRYFASG